MAERKRIGLREVRALGPRSIVWDAAVPGFGVRRQSGTTVAYVLFYRTWEGRQRWHTIGRHGAPWTPETARDEARKLLGEVAAGADPANEKSARRGGLTVAELTDRYLETAQAGRLLTRRKTPKRPLTLASDRGRLERHVKPLLGSLPVAAVTPRDIEGAMHAIAEGVTAARTKTKPRGLARVTGGRGVATRTIGLLGAVFAYAVKQGMRPDNPVRGIEKFAENRRARRLSDQEYALLGNALHQAEGRIWPAAVAVTQFLALTGWRRGEALGLRWAELDLARRTARLADTKTGFSLRPISHRACNVLQGMSRTGDLVFPATRGDGQMVGFRKLWLRIMRLGSLPPDVTPHVLRHSFASLAADLGYSEPTIAALIGHKGHSITSRYVHAADAVLLAAADVVAQKTAELLDGAPPSEMPQ